jgi:hypothetical protein
MICFLNAIGLTPGGSSAVHIYTQTIHRTTQKQTIGRTAKDIGSLARAILHLCGFYPGICHTAEEKARKTLSQGSRRVSAGTKKIIKRICTAKTYGFLKVKNAFGKVCAAHEVHHVQTLCGCTQPLPVNFNKPCCTLLFSWCIILFSRNSN